MYQTLLPSLLEAGVITEDDIAGDQGLKDLFEKYRELKEGYDEPEFQDDNDAHVDLEDIAEIIQELLWISEYNKPQRKKGKAKTFEEFRL